MPAVHANSVAVTVNEVLALLLQLCRPLQTERVTLDNALGRVLRETVHAPEDIPAFDCSAVDGYAVRLDDPRNRFRIVDEIRAGDWKPRQLEQGEAVRIATGGALPCDGLQVVMKEDVQPDGDFVRVIVRTPKTNIRLRGENARAGQVLAGVGTIVRPGALALLASVGQIKPLVTRLPKVAHIVTGNEIVPPEQTPTPGQIRDSNSTLVSAFLGLRRIVPERYVAPEDETCTRRVLEKLDDDVDLILISGGASVGEHDFTVRLLESLGYTIHVRKVNARPGKPLVVAQSGRRLAFGLPGNPLAHFVCLNLYVHSALLTLAGCSAEPLFQNGRLATDLETDSISRETFWPGRWQFADGTITLTPLRWASSGDLTSLANANALIRVPPNSERLEAGSRVAFAPTDKIL